MSTPTRLAPDPVLPSPEAVRARGAELYAQMCAVCHGVDGEGYKADQAPALAQQDFLASVSDDFMRRAIAVGRRGSTMSAWARELSGPLAGQDIDAVVAFLRSRLKGPRATLDERPRSGDPERGRVVYERQCQSCHGARGKGGPNVRIGDGDLLDVASDGFLRYAIMNGRPGTQMQSYKPTLGEPGVEDVLAYLRSLPAHESPEPLVAQPGRPPPLPLGRVPLNPQGPEPRGFKHFPDTTSLEVIHRELERKAKMVLLDARAPSDYSTQHIAGAVSVPFYDPTPYFAKLPKDAWLVCYCACPHAESGELAQKLTLQGFKKVTVLDEGLGAWMAHGYKTSSGEKP